MSVVYTGYDGNGQVARYQSPPQCGNTSVNQTLDGSSAGTGGITEVYIDVYVGSTRVGREFCSRSTNSCVRA